MIRHAELVREKLRSDSQHRFGIAVYLAAGMIVFSLALVWRTGCCSSACCYSRCAPRANISTALPKAI